MAVAKLTNLTTHAVSLSAPYRGIIPPGGSVNVPDFAEVALLNLGGAEAIATILQVEPGRIEDQIDADLHSSGALPVPSLDIGDGGVIRFFEHLPGLHFIGLQGPSPLLASTVFTLPDSDGFPGQFIATDGSGNLSFQSPAMMSGWLLTGNSGTGGTAVLGTTDTAAFSIVQNGGNQLTFDGTGAIQIGVPILVRPDPSSNLVLASDIAQITIWGSTTGPNSSEIEISGNSLVFELNPFQKVFIANSTSFSLQPYGFSSGNTVALTFMELAANGTNFVGFKAPDSIASNVVWVLPAADGTAGQALTTNGSHILSWSSITPSGSAGGELTGTYPNPSLSNAAVIGKVLTGYASGAGTVSASDSILQAIEKLNGNTVANDGLVVHLAGIETITGSKTFSSGLTSGGSVTFTGGAGVEINRDTTNNFLILTGGTDVSGNGLITLWGSTAVLPGQISLNGTPISFRTSDGVERGRMTATGLNSCAIGATTASTGAFTSVTTSANSGLTMNGTDPVLSMAGSATDTISLTSLVNTLTLASASGAGANTFNLGTGAGTGPAVFNIGTATNSSSTINCGGGTLNITSTASDTGASITIQPGDLSTSGGTAGTVTIQGTSPSAGGGTGGNVVIKGGSRTTSVGVIAGGVQILGGSAAGIGGGVPGDVTIEGGAGRGQSGNVTISTGTVSTNGFVGSITLSTPHALGSGGTAGNITLSPDQTSAMGKGVVTINAPTIMNDNVGIGVTPFSGASSIHILGTTSIPGARTGVGILYVTSAGDLRYRGQSTDSLVAPA